MYILNHELVFPQYNHANEDGLLAIGGDLSTERLVLAYANGIFPWYSDDEPILWYCPNVRFVLIPEKLRISKSMQQLLKKNTFHFTINKAFDDVVKHCSNVNRPGQNGTWLGNDMKNAYTKLHQQGIAISAEAWCDNQLVGGLYGVLSGHVFCGESMFALKSNASKFAFIKMVQYLQTVGIKLIDCQIYSEHLESLGAIDMPINVYLDVLNGKSP